MAGESALFCNGRVLFACLLFDQFSRCLVFIFLSTNKKKNKTKECLRFVFRGFVVVLKTGSVIHTIGAFKFVLPESECTHDLRASSGEITLKEFIIMAATPGQSRTHLLCSVGECVCVRVLYPDILSVDV